MVLPITGETTKFEIEIDHITLLMPLLRRLQNEQDRYSDEYDLLESLILSIAIGVNG